jgi:hypothetical protein
VTLALGQNLSLEIVLHVAAIDQKVTVVAQNPQVETRRTDPSALINRQQINSLPLNGRSFVGLSVVNAGVVEDHDPATGRVAQFRLHHPRSAREVEQHPDRRPGQQRYEHGVDPKILQPGRDSRVSCVHQCLFGRIRAGQRRRDQHHQDHVADVDDATQWLAKVRQQWRPGHDLTIRANYWESTNENIEIWGGLIARSNGIVDLRDDWTIAGSQTDWS